MPVYVDGLFFFCKVEVYKVRLLFRPHREDERLSVKKGKYYIDKKEVT